LQSSPFRWLDVSAVVAVHESQIAEHGGASGIRDAGLWDSALARPRNAAAYGETDVATLAVLYALGIIENHPFVDGNKRVGLLVLEGFLALNGRELVADDANCYAAIAAVAAGDTAHDAFVAWVQENSRAR
jgi:death on curing protein